jgi:hypothetical protein
MIKERKKLIVKLLQITVFLAPIIFAIAMFVFFVVKYFHIMRIA